MEELPAGQRPLPRAHVERDCDSLVLLELDAAALLFDVGVACGVLLAPVDLVAVLALSFATVVLPCTRRTRFCGGAPVVLGVAEAACAARRCISLVHSV